MNEKMNSSGKKVRLGVFIPMLILTFGVTLVAVLIPEQFYNIEDAFVNSALHGFGWMLHMCVLICFILCVYLMLSRHGDIKFGGPNAKPELSTFSWFAITLTSGVGIGILFWGIAEPLTFFVETNYIGTIEPRTEAAAMFALSRDFLQWTFTPYAVFAICGIITGLTHYNMNLPYSQGATLYPLFKSKVFGALGSVIDVVCGFGIVFSVAASTAQLALQFATGLGILAGVKQTTLLLATIIIAVSIATVFFCVGGIKKAIAWLASQNVKIFVFLLLFVLFFGPTSFICNIGTQGLGEYVSDFFRMSTYTSPIDGNDWPKWWTYYNWCAWISGAPISGMFLARVAYGRSIRSYVGVNVFGAGLFGVIWFSIFGGSAIFFEMQDMTLYDIVNELGMESAIFRFFEYFPLSSVISWVMMLVILVSFITMSDTQATAIASLCTTGNTQKDPEPPLYMKIILGFGLGAIALISITIGTGGEITAIDGTKQIAIVAGVPLAFYVFLQIFAVIKIIFNREKYDVAYFPETAERAEVPEELDTGTFTSEGV